MIRVLVVLLSLVPLASADSPTAPTAPIAIDPVVAAMQRGWTSYSSGNYAASATAYRDAARIAPTSAEPLLGLTLPLMANREWRAALDTCDAILARLPGEPTARARRAWALYNLGRFTDATDAYTALVRDYPSDVDLRAGLGWSLCRDGRVVDASAAFSSALALNPEHVAAGEGADACGW